ncbi:MAG TPA: hypothetical protein VFT98_04720 [Myxococcota bacterium]|nr:hypothetical protein [Myxococcota bacterium]
MVERNERMSEWVSRCFRVLSGAALLLAVMPGAAHAGKPPKISVEPIAMMGVAVPGGTLLARTKEGVFASIHAAGLAEGTVATGWIAIFQNPEHCATDPCSPADLTNASVEASVLALGGRVVGTDGAVDLGGFRAVGDATGPGGPPGTPNVGLLRPFKAEIHLVIRTHGPASMDPAVLLQQLSSFNGGCPPNTCANLMASVHQP